MLGESISSLGWPQCGEIDIMEHVGYDQGLVHGSIHIKTITTCTEHKNQDQNI